MKVCYKITTAPVGPLPSSTSVPNINNSIGGVQIILPPTIERNQVSTTIVISTKDEKSITIDSSIEQRIHNNVYVENLNFMDDAQKKYQEYDTENSEISFFTAVHLV